MGRRRKNTSGHELLVRLQGQENQNDRETLQDQPQQNIDDQLDDQFTNVDMTDNSIENDIFDSSSCPKESYGGDRW